MRAWADSETDLCTVCLESAEPHAVALLTFGRERARQVSVEGYDEGHDDGYRNGQLGKAAACYAIVASSPPDRDAFPAGHPPSLWPWDPEHWKPKDPASDLVRAGALLVAELERRLRAEARDRESQTAGGQA